MAVDAVDSNAVVVLHKSPTPPPVEQRVVSDENNVESCKRKRTKLNHRTLLISSSAGSGSHPVKDGCDPGSSKDPFDDHQLARILVKLARGGGGGGQQQPGVVPVIDGGGGSKDASAFRVTKDTVQDRRETEAEAVGTTQLYKCTLCTKSFKSHQALGGHKASHRKFPNPVNAAVIPEYVGRPSTISPMAASNPNISLINPSGKPHVCKVCNMSFPSGQALGGHQRRHYVSTGDGPLNGGNRHATATISRDVPNPSSSHSHDPAARVPTTLTLTAGTVSGVTSSDGGHTSEAPAAMTQDLELNNPTVDLEFRLGFWADRPETKETQTLDDREVQSPSPVKKMRLLGSLLSMN